MGITEYIESRLSHFENMTNQQISNDMSCGVVGEFRHMILSLGLDKEFGERSAIQVTRAFRNSLEFKSVKLTEEVKWHKYQ